MVKTCHTDKAHDSKVWGKGGAAHCTSREVQRLQMGSVILQDVQTSSSCSGCTSNEEIISLREVSVSLGRQAAYLGD